MVFVAALVFALWGTIIAPDHMHWYVMYAFAGLLFLGDICVTLRQIRGYVSGRWPRR